jgi:dynein heavy chain 1
MIKPEVLALEAADASAIEEVNLAYENVKEVDGLDITKEGAEAWEAAMKRYEERIDRVETRITARLRDQVQSQSLFSTGVFFATPGWGGLSYLGLPRA